MQALTRRAGEKGLAAKPPYIPLRKLRQLKLRSTALDNLGLGCFLKLCGRHLRSLDISNTDVGPSLETLFAGMSLGDADSAPLRKLGLRGLRLTPHDVADLMVKLFCASAPTFTSLHTLLLADMTCGLDSAEKLLALGLWTAEETHTAPEEARARNDGHSSMVLRPYDGKSNLNLPGVGLRKYSPPGFSSDGCHFMSVSAFKKLDVRAPGEATHAGTADSPARSTCICRRCVRRGSFSASTRCAPSGAWTWGRDVWSASCAPSAHPASAGPRPSTSATCFRTAGSRTSISPAHRSTVSFSLHRGQLDTAG